MGTRFAIRPKIAITDIDSSHFRIFVSYKTEDYVYAHKIASGLRRLGFPVLFLTPDAMAPRLKDDALKKKLALHVFHADAVCMVVTNQSLKSPWVQLEFAEAAQSIGRIIFVSKEPIAAPGDDLFHAVNLSVWSQALTVKHTTIQVDGTDDSIALLADQLINDPEVGWIDSKLGVEPAYPPRGKAFKLESIRRRLARIHVMAEDAYRGRRLCDVVPFVWDEIGCEPGDVVGAIKWMIFRCGRRGLAKALLQDEIEIFHDIMPMNLWHNAILKVEMGGNIAVDDRSNSEFELEVVNCIAQLASNDSKQAFNSSLNMLVVSDLREPGCNPDEIPGAIAQVSWSFPPPDLNLINALAKSAYPDRIIGAVVGRIRRNFPSDEGLDLSEYGIEILKKDRHDILPRLESHEVDYCIDTYFLPAGNANLVCVVVGTILEPPR